MRAMRLVAVVGLMLVGMASWGAETTAELPGLAGHLYGDANFAAYAGPVKVDSWVMDVDVSKFPWPGEKPAGWSLAVYGQIQVDKPGAYVFKVDNARAELWLGDQHVSSDQKTPVELPAGKVRLRMYAKSDTDKPLANVHVALMWKGPEAANFEGFAPALFSHTADDEDRESVYAAWLPSASRRRRSITGGRIP